MHFMQFCIEKENDINGKFVLIKYTSEVSKAKN